MTRLTTRCESHNRPHHALAAMALQPPGVPVLVAGVGKAGLQNAAIAAAQIFGQADPEDQDKLAAYLNSNRPSPNFNLDARKESA